MELAIGRTAEPKPASRSAASVVKETDQNGAIIWVVGAGLVALILKLSIAYNTFGTNDVASFYMFARSLNQHGLEWTYRHGVPWLSNSAVFNHPPLTAYYLQLIDFLSRQESVRGCGVTFPFLVRLPGIIADFVSVLFLLASSKVASQTRLPRSAMILFALSPVSIIVSGFHGNTDPVMVMFLIIAAYMCLRERPIMCGVFFALSCQIKIVPFLVFPVVLFFWLGRKAAIRFLAPFVMLTVVMWSQPLFNFPLLFARNVLAYGGYWGNWGITYWLQLTHTRQFSATGFSDLPWGAALTAWGLKLIIVSAVGVMAWRRRMLGGNAVISSIAYAWIIFFVFAPGFCSYYLIWLAPFVLMLSPVFYASLTATSSLFLFFFYNGLAGGLPWFMAVQRFTNPDRFNLLMPWAVWPWATLVCGVFLLWKEAGARWQDLFSLGRVPAQPR